MAQNTSQFHVPVTDPVVVSDPVSNPVFNPVGNYMGWTFPTQVTKTEYIYDFQNFFHPYLGELIEQLNKGTLKDMLDPNFVGSLSEVFFAQAYALIPSDVVAVTSHPKNIDLCFPGPYGDYNWELCFHFPMAVATHLSQNQRFAEAQRWFHYIFDPTSNDLSEPAPKRFWKFLAFRNNADVQPLAARLELLSSPDGTPGKASVLQGYAAIRNQPFQPHAVARTRIVAYQLNVVMKYLDNLLDWGDSLFAQDTRETINDATMRYILAANILGPRPEEVPNCGKARAMSFSDLKAGGLDAMGNAMVALETQFPFNGAVPQSSGEQAGPQSGATFGIGRALYFCVPHNDELLAYWDKVADRLYKIRNCMNLQGVVRQLALFEPRIDPRMLVKAAAAGISVDSILGGTSQSITPVRSQFLIQKALELCGEVRSLGSALLSAIEKGEAESLALLRQGHEIKIQQLSQDIRFLQWKQAEESSQALLRTRASALERYAFYLRLIGQAPDDATAPAQLALDRSELTEENFDEAYGDLVGQYEKAVGLQTYPGLKMSGAGAPASLAGSSSGALYLTRNEDLELNKLMPLARDTRLAASVTDIIGSVLTLIPDVSIDLHYWGLGMHSTIFGGSKLADAAKIKSEVLRTVAGYAQDQAGMAARTAGYERRSDEWYLQANLAARELMQIGRQILGSLISEQVAMHEYLSAKQQVDNAQEVDTFLHSKFTNADLYGWMQGETARLYYQYYRFAVNLARKAEQAMKRELMRPELDDTDFVQINYWDGGRKGLLAGEALHLDVKRMEMAYHDYNVRELELTRHVSLRQLDPVQLLTLKTTGKCTINIPEWFFDRECPGHYMRRVRTVGLSLPSVVSPYTSLNCTLSLLKSSIRVSPTGAYPRTGSDDARFTDYFGPVQTIVTSGGTNDSGLFETNLNDARILPFEGAGAISEWSLSLPGDLRAFDYGTISDVILHMRYTARQGGDTLGELATAELKKMIKTATGSELALLLSLKHDFPTEWAAFVNSPANTPFQFTLKKTLFPFMAQDMAIAVDVPALFGNSGYITPTSPITPVGTNNLSSTQPGIDYAIALPQSSIADQVYVIFPYTLN